MTYVCIKCRTRWTVSASRRDAAPTIEADTEEISGGVCKECFIEHMRERQRRQGFHDCFGRATEWCIRTWCNYHEVCCKGMESRK